MQFALLPVFALFTAVLAMPQQGHHELARRQAPAAPNSVPLNVAAMTDADGNVVEFSAGSVYQDAKNKGA